MKTGKPSWTAEITAIYRKKKHEPFLFGLEKGREQNYLASLGFSRVTCITPQQLKQKYFQGAPRGAKMHWQWGIAHAVV
jgi:O-methyltransferase involved in polyketide biosynthesis